jgi:hypothetical protein
LEQQLAKIPSDSIFVVYFLTSSLIRCHFNPEERLESSKNASNNRIRTYFYPRGPHPEGLFKGIPLDV